MLSPPCRTQCTVSAGAYIYSCLVWVCLVVLPPVQKYKAQIAELTTENQDMTEKIKTTTASAGMEQLQLESALKQAKASISHMTTSFPLLFAKWHQTGVN